MLPIVNNKSFFKSLIKPILPRFVMVCRLQRNNKKRVLLTFDDGPDPELTLQILEILQEYKVRAIFFVIANRAAEFPEIVKKIEKDGHFIANHTYSHPHDRALGFFSYRSEILTAQKTLNSLVSKSSKLFRPPCGVFSLTTFFAAKSLGMRIVLWSNGGGEWSVNQSQSAEAIACFLKKTIRDRQILLLHDNNRKIPEVLEIILPYLEMHGYDLGSAANEVTNGI